MKSRLKSVYCSYYNYTSILSVCGKLENRTTIDKASSRSRMASIKLGYLQIHNLNFAVTSFWMQIALQQTRYNQGFARKTDSYTKY